MPRNTTCQHASTVPILPAHDLVASLQNLTFYQAFSYLVNRSRPLFRTNTRFRVFGFPTTPVVVMQPKTISGANENSTSEISIPSSPRPACRTSNVSSPPNAGPRLARSISSSSGTSVCTLSINPRAPRNFGVEPILKDGNSDEIEGSAMNISTIINTLNSGTEDQITLALFETQQVLEACREYAVLSIVPVICKKFVQWAPAIQVSAAETLLVVVSSKIPAHVAKFIYDTTLQVIRISSDSCVSEMCGQTLVRTLPHVSWSPKELDEIVDQLETRRASLDGGHRFSVSRKLTARILGSLAMCSKREDLKRRIMYRAMFLANDEDLEVRGMIAESMSFIGASIHVSVVEDELWPCISKLIRDKNARVHAASMRTLSFIAAAHASQSPTSVLYRHLIPPIIVKECTRIRRAAEADQRTVDDDTYLVLEINSEIFGELLNSCWNYMPDDVTRRDAFKAFLAMSTCNGPIVRKYCAYNLPGVSKCFLGRHRVEMSNIVEFLSRDAEPETRYVLASGIHETVKILAGRDTINNLFQAVLVLLQDENPLVRMSTLKYFEDLIAQLSKHMGYNSVRKLEPIFQNLQLLSEGNWRTQELLSKQLLMAAPLVPSPSILSNVLPLLYKLAEQSSYLVRKAAMAAVATCMRYIPDTTEREKAMDSFRTEWGNGSIYWMRIGFIDSAKAALDSYSRCLFRDTFASALLRLADDQVPNVRVRVALILPLLTCACHQMVEFKAALNKLKNDSDKDVLDALQGIDARIAESLEKGQECFEEDMKREEEEQDLYSKHLNEKKEAFRRKKGNIKRAKTMFMKRSVKVLPSSSKNTAQVNYDKNKENSATNNQSDSQHMLSGSQTPKGQLQGRRSLNLEKKELSRTWIRARSNSVAKQIDMPPPAENAEFAGVGNPSSSSRNAEASPQRKTLPKRSRSFILKRS